VSGSVADSLANPVRRVITLLEGMAKKVSAEGEKEEELYKKFMCYCSGTGNELAAAVAEGQAKVPQLESSIQEAGDQLQQTKLDLKQAQDDRTAAKETLASAVAQREKQNKAFLEKESELKMYVDGLTKAITAIERGVTGGALLQSEAGGTLLRKAVAESSATEYDRGVVMGFLQGTGEYVPKSGEVTGILKQMKDEFAASLQEVQDAEAKAVAVFGDLQAAKTKQINVLTAAIEKKTERIGTLQVEIVSMKQELEATQGSLAEDLEFAANIKKDCESKSAEWEERKRLRAEELVAIHETIKILSDDDALELFKKTLPAPSFVQMEASSRALRKRALALLDRSQGNKAPAERTQLDFLTMALQGRDFSFAKIIAMIDNMVKLLADEQAEDEVKKEYCTKSIDDVEDKGKELQKRIADYQVSLDDAAETMEALIKDVDELTKGIAELDKSVTEATETRKEENDEYKELMSSNSAAKELLNFAKNRLNKFYNPKLYKPPKEDEAPAASALQLSKTPALVQISRHSLHGGKRDAPEPPPDTWGAYGKKSQETTGAIAMIDLLVKDLDKEMTEAKVGEKNSQASYEQLMADSASKRAADLKSISKKTSEKANLEQAKEADTMALKSSEKELMATKVYESNLHAECDWIMQFFDMRKAARAEETDNLKAAKAILSGADFSFAQQAQHGAPPPRLRGA
jgi:hypothetical protein